MRPLNVSRRKGSSPSAAATPATPTRRTGQRDEQYKRYIWLVQLFRGLGWDNTKLHDASPFQIVDPGFNAILIRSCADLADLADTLGEIETATQSRAMAEKAVAAMETLWSDKHGQYLCYDRDHRRAVDSPSIGGLLAAFARSPAARAAAIADRIEVLASAAATTLSPATTRPRRNSTACATGAARSG